MRPSNVILRVAALAAVAAAVAIVALLLFGRGGGYEVTARFANASQLVTGNLVRIGGADVGAVERIALTSDGQVDVTMSVGDEDAPLRRGTTAVIRPGSLSGVANRFVDLQLAAGPDAANPEIPDGGEIDADYTDEPTELDQVFNTLDPETRAAVRRFIEGSAEALRDRGGEARNGYRYLNPALSRSSALLRELGRDDPALEAFLADSARLVTTLAERRDELAALVGNANRVTAALGSEKEALADSIARLPAFMRTANTTFVNLDSTLDSLAPLVAASRPLVSRAGAGNDLQELLPELRRLSADAHPALSDLDRLVRRRGAENDLIDLQETFPPLAAAALDTGERSVNPAAVPFEGNDRRVEGRSRAVGEVPGAFPELAGALTGASRIVAFGRPYTPDLFGWFDDFSHAGGYDAVHAGARAEIIFNEVSVPDGNDPGFQAFLDAAGSPAYGQLRRCPGAAEAPAADGSNVFSPREQEALDCLEDDRATGDYAGSPYDRVGPGGGPFP